MMLEHIIEELKSTAEYKDLENNIDIEQYKIKK